LLYWQEYAVPFDLFIMNHSYLLQDELQYEVCMRGISSGSDVHMLRNLFRSTVSEGVPADMGNLRQLCIEDLCSKVVSKTAELQALVKKSSPNLPLLVLRLRMRLFHLTGGLGQCI
jgi:hypothetical protein